MDNDRENGTRAHRRRVGFYRDGEQAQEVERTIKKTKAKKYEMTFEMLQPWSTFVMTSQLPSPILEKMIKITDEIIENKESAIRYNEETLAGQIEDEFIIELEILEREELMDFFLNVCKTYVVHAQCQALPSQKEEMVNEEWLAQLTSMWMVSQKDNEYNPIHIHSNCHLSCVMYLKIPEFLPSRKSNGEDGSIIFTNNASTDKIWAGSILQILPHVGDFFIFPSTQHHQVYPFRTADGKGERRSVSFNAQFTSKTEQEFIKKQMEEQKKQQTDSKYLTGTVGDNWGGR